MAIEIATTQRTRALVAGVFLVVFFGLIIAAQYWKNAYWIAVGVVVLFFLSQQLWRVTNPME